MKNPLAVLILLAGLMLCNVAQAVTVAYIDVKPQQCQAHDQIAADLQVVTFPSDWTIYVACNDVTWKQILRRQGITNTDAAYTSQEKKFTVINGMMYSSAFNWEGYTQKYPIGVLKHELGHITCNTGSEDKADHYAETGQCK